MFFVFFKQKTAYDMRISDWSSDVCSSDLLPGGPGWRFLRPLHLVRRAGGVPVRLHGKRDSRGADGRQGYGHRSAGRSGHRDAAGGVPARSAGTAPDPVRPDRDRHRPIPAQRPDELHRQAARAAARRRVPGHSGRGEDGMTRLPDAKPLLRADSLTMRFGGITAVSALSFDIMPGQVVGLIGPNGAGKTTCFNMLTGFYTPTEGRVWFKDREITDDKPYAIARLGLVRSFQKTNVMKRLTAFENVLTGHYMTARQALVETFFPGARLRQAESTRPDESRLG